MVSFNSIPTNVRTPFTAVEFDASRAQQGPSLLSYRALLLGQKLKSASAAANSFHRVTNADQVVVLAGRGSMLHRQARAWFKANKSTELWIGVLDDNSAGVYASGSLVFSGTATADGVIDLYIGGDHVQVAVASGDASSAIATAVAAAIGKHSSGTVTFSSAQAADTITVDGTVFTGASGAVTPGAASFSIDTGNTEAAASAATQINAHATAGTKVRATAASGVLTLRAITGGAASDALTLATSNGTRLAPSGATLTGGTDDTDLPVHAFASSSTVTVQARNNGTHANEIDMRANYYAEAEELPAGVGLAITAMNAGASNPSLTSLIAAMGDAWYQVIACPYTDATSLTSLETEMARRNGPMRQIDGLVVVAKNDSYANVAALGNARNSAFLSILRTQGSPTTPAECSAHVAGVIAYYSPIDPARPLQTLPLPGIMAPAEADRDDLEERNLLLYDGISTFKVGAGDAVMIERMITTYKTNAAGSPDTAYLDVTTVLTLLYLRYSFRAMWSSRYPRHKLANDGTRFGSGQAVMTPKLGKAEACSWFRQMEARGLVENYEQFKADLVVERNVGDPNRLDFLLSPDLINQLIVTGAKIQFLL